MKSYFFIVLGILAIALMSVQRLRKSTPKEGVGISFQQGTFNDALLLAKKGNKVVFLDIYATWCGPCKMLKRNTFSDSEVGEVFNKNFINIAIDAEKGEGEEIARKYKVSGFPTLLFVNPDGSVVKSTMGYHNPKQFIELGKSVLNK